jgi:hypothetical protein
MATRSFRSHLGSHFRFGVCCCGINRRGFAREASKTLVIVVYPHSHAVLSSETLRAVEASFLLTAV